MLGKLLKHEFRATGRIMLPLLCVLLLLSVFAGLSVRGLDRLEGMGFLGTLYVLVLVAFFLGLFAVGIIALVLMIQRFYKSLLRDEGYLSMTLPVSVDEHIISKLLTSFVWFAVVTLLSALAMTLMFVIGSRLSFSSDIDFLEFRQALQEGIRVLGGGNVALLALEWLLIIFLGTCLACLRCYAAMAIGCSAAQHKLLLSFVAFIGISIVMSLIQNGILFEVLPHLDALDFSITSAADISAAGGILLLHGSLWILILGLAIYSAIFYFTTRWFLKNRLNLA